LPQGEALQNYWRLRLPEGERKVLDCALVVFPGAVSRESISETTEFKRSTRDAYLQRLKTRRLVEIVGAGEVRASALLFD
jgi:hypothetical protein